MDWFERITGFKEGAYGETKAALSVAGGRLHSLHTDRSYEIGLLETPSLEELRKRTASACDPAGPQLRLSALQGDARRLHGQPLNRHALFQVASRFNLLEMTAPEITPEDGVTRYQDDRTQGSACAMAAGAATIYRNYLAPVEDGTGQTRDRQIDCLADLAAGLAGAGMPLWEMRNGYAMCSGAALDRIDRELAQKTPDELDRLRGLLRVGVHWNAEVTDSATPGQNVTQALCSALPVAHSGLPPARWQRLGTLVLQAAYEATLRLAVLNREQTGCPTVFLTSLGAGTFGNPPEWAEAAIAHAMELMRGSELDLRLVSFGPVPSRK